MKNLLVAQSGGPSAAIKATITGAVSYTHLDVYKRQTYENKDLIQLYDLEKCLVYFTTALKSNEVVLEKLRKHIGLRHSEEDEELLEDVLIENKQAMEMTDIYHNILRSKMSLFCLLYTSRCV